MHNELGKVYEKEGRVGKAVEYYRKAVLINPYAAAAHYNLGQALERAGLLQKAFEHYGRFMQLGDPAYIEAEEQLRDRLKKQYGLKLK